MFKPCICAQLQPTYLHSFHWMLFDFIWQRAMNCMQQTEVEFSALLSSHTLPAFLHVRKSRPTLVYFWMRHMLCKRGVRRWPYLPLILIWWWLCGGFVQQDSSWSVFVCIWRRVKLSFHSSSWNCVHNESNKVSHSPRTSRVHRVWYCTFIRWQRKENYLGHLVVVFGGEWYLQSASVYAKWG